MAAGCLGSDTSPEKVLFYSHKKGFEMSSFYGKLFFSILKYKG